MVVDSTNVISFCPKLSWKYNCHISVEICVFIHDVNYIYKYIYKGHNYIIIQFEKQQDEIKQYLDARYIGALEAA